MSTELTLDDEASKQANKYSKRSGYTLLCTLLVCFAMFMATLARAMKWDWIISPRFLLENLPILLLACILLGFIFAMLSLRRKEPSSKMKTVGLIGNGFFFAMLLVMIASIIQDIFKFL